jgi:hypothetical protein
MFKRINENVYQAFEKETVMLNFGLLAPLLVDQLSEQQILIDIRIMNAFEKVRESTNCLYFQDFITESIRNKILDKLMKRILKTIETELKKG